MQQVKVVRETMNRTLELWNEVPGEPERVLSWSQSKSSAKGNCALNLYNDESTLLILGISRLDLLHN